MISDNIFTVVGASGFLGKNMVSFLRGAGCSKIYEINSDTVIDSSKDYGVVYYCAGVSIDFNKKPFDTVNAHVVRLMDFLQNARFTKLIYISSTRLYSQASNTNEELECFNVKLHDIYNQTKLLGENLCLSSQREVVILRISHVTGYNVDSPYFLWTLFRKVYTGSTIEINESKNSCRDYLPLDDFLRIMLAVAENGITGIFNVASGVNITNEELLNMIVSNKEMISYGSYDNINPRIDNSKIARAVNYNFQDPKVYVKSLWDKFLRSV